MTSHLDDNYLWILVGWKLLMFEKASVYSSTELYIFFGFIFCIHCDNSTESDRGIFGGN